MYQKSKILSRVKNGELSVCNDCQNYNLVFNNLFFQFNEEQLNKFREYVSKIEISYWLGFSYYSSQRRKIPVETFHQNLILIFDYHEIEELKILLGINKRDSFDILAISDVDYNLILN
jgi:hypothetical protein